MGASLVQRVNDEVAVIAFLSRSLKKPERNYSTTEKEILGVVWAMESWEDYLLPSLKTIVYTDHQALQWLFETNHKIQRHIRWVLRLQGFNFEVKFRPGKDNQVADCLSRSPISHTACSVELQPDYEGNECYAKECTLLKPKGRGRPKKLVDWVACDGCQRYYHCECVNIKIEEAEKLPTWYCPTCIEIIPADQRVLNESSSDDTSFEGTIPEKETFINEQHQDEKFSQVIDYLESKKLPLDVKSKKKIIAMSKLYDLKDGVLVRKRTEKTLIVVPESLVKCVIRNYHSKPTSGHLGVRKTLDKISKIYWWPNIKRNVQYFIKSCMPCQYCKPLYKKPVGEMRTIESSKPNEILAADWMGPFPPSAEKKYQYLLVLCDHFSKFVFLFPTVHANNRTLRAIVNHIFCVFGSWERFMSDNGPQFISEKFRDFLKTWNIVQTLCSPYHAQANFVERTNRNLKSMLSCFHSADHTHWPDYLNEFQFALNSVTHDSTGFTPALLFIGRELTGPGDNAVLTLPNSHGIVETAEKKAKINMNKRAKKNKALYDKTRQTDVTYKTGDRVLLKSHVLSNAKRNKSAKLAEKWYGPLTVVKRISPLTYQVRDPDVQSRQKMTHVEQMKPYHA